MRLVLALLLCLPLAAQERLWRASVATLAGAHVADFASSIGRMEANPLLRGPDGRFSPARGAAIKLGTTLPLIYVQRRTPRYKRVWTIINFVVAGVVAVAAAYNVRRR